MLDLHLAISPHPVAVVFFVIVSCLNPKPGFLSLLLVIAAATVAASPLLQALPGMRTTTSAL